MRKQKFRDLKSNSCGTKSDWINVATVRHLTRIITYLSEVESVYHKQIERKTGMNYAVVSSALTFLLNHKIVLIFKTQSSVKHYILNSLFK